MKRFRSGGSVKNPCVLSMAEGPVEGLVRRPAFSWFDKLTTNGKQNALDRPEENAAVWNNRL
ncbi:MAG: hypothetical protein F4X34_05935 [Chloroflexi bacterium]|nr:hypothetical protein [Chloroflexota bacterium]